MKKDIYKIFCLAILVIIFWHPLNVAYSQRDYFFSPGYNAIYPQLKNQYYSSQYAKKNSTSIMPDEYFESFAGGIFLRGLNPILIVHEHPPMGRYIIALSIFLFDNARTTTLFCLVLSVLGIYLISKQVLKQTVYSLIPLSLFVNEPQFINKFYFAPLLEPIHEPFIVFAIYFFMRGLTSKKYLWWFAATSIMLGFVISIKFFILGAFLIGAFVMALFFEKNPEKIVKFVFTLPLSLLILFIAYFRTIESGYSLWDIIKIQKYIFAYHKSQLISPASFWDLLLFNRWHTWWGSMSISSDPQWVIFWPLSALITLIFLIFIIRKNMSFSKEEKVSLFWVMGYSVLLSVGNTTTRYFFPLIPFFYILAISVIKKLLIKIV